MTITVNTFRTLKEYNEIKEFIDSRIQASLKEIMDVKPVTASKPVTSYTPKAHSAIALRVKCANLTVEVEKLKTENENTKRDYSKLLERYNASNGLIEQGTRIMNEHSDAHDKLKKDYETLKGEFTKLLNDYEVTRTRNQNQFDLITQLRNDLSSEYKKNDKLKKDNETLKNEHEKLQNKYLQEKKALNKKYGEIANDQWLANYYANINKQDSDY